MNKSIIFAGTGGQGILFIGKLLAYCGMIEGREVSWFPSYGPEMRGGTANCCVRISDSPVSSPLISSADYLIAMNMPSLRKFSAVVRPTGKIFVDSTIVKEVLKSNDDRSFCIPATETAIKNNLDDMANVILFGKFLKETDIVSMETAETVFKKIIPQNKSWLVEKNIKALMLGKSFA